MTVETSTDEASSAGWASDFEVGRLVGRAAIGGVVLVGLLMVLGHRYQAELLSLSASFVDAGGLISVFAAWYALDSVPFPLLPQDSFSALALVGGLSPVSIMAVSSAGSLLGGTTSWALSRRLGQVRAVRRYFEEGRWQKLYSLVGKYGALALAIGSVSPLPYSVAAWACGLSGIGYQRFIAVSLLRIPRIAFYLYLIHLGSLNFTAA